MAKRFHTKQIGSNRKGMQQTSYSLGHLLGTVTTPWLDSDSVVTAATCQQHGDWAANGSVVTMLWAVSKGDNNVTVQSPYSHIAA